MARERFLQQQGVVSPLNAVLAPGQSQQFTATVSGASSQTVTWSVEPAVGTISSTGVYTAPATISGPQTTTVVATSVVDPSFTGRAMLPMSPVCNKLLTGRSAGPLLNVDRDLDAAANDARATTWVSVSHAPFGFPPGFPPQ